MTDQHNPAYEDPPPARRVSLLIDPQEPPQIYDGDLVWLGDLAGFTVEADNVGTLTLEHRCGWSEDIGPADHFLANIVDRVIQVGRRHRCECPHAGIPREDSHV